MIYWLFSFFLGAIAVLQGGLNRQIASDIGLSTAIFLNSFILLIVACVFILVCQFFPQWVPEVFPPNWTMMHWRWWFAIPAFCGFLLIVGIPASIPKLGALGVFLCIVVGQMTFSLLWDLKVEHMPLDSRRLIGAALALLGLIVTYWKNPFS